MAVTLIPITWICQHKKYLQSFIINLGLSINDIPNKNGVNSNLEALYNRREAILKKNGNKAHSPKCEYMIVKT